MTPDQIIRDLELRLDAMERRQSGNPTGTVLQWAGAASTATVPRGYLACDGSAVSRASYAALFATIGTKYGAGDNSTTFNLPNGNGGQVPHGIPATQDTRATTYNTGNNSADHTHTTTVGNASADHTHTTTLSTESATHSHTVSNGTQSANHTHTVTDVYNATGTTATGTKTTSIESVTHSHTPTVGTQSANHTHTVSAAGGASVTHSHTVTNGNNSVAHAHAVPMFDVSFIIKT